MHFWLRGVFVAVRAFLQLRQAEATLIAVRGFSLWCLLSLQSMATRVRGLRRCRGGLEHRFSSCGAQTWLLLGVWDLPRSGIEPESSALAGEFLTTEPPGEALSFNLNSFFLLNLTSTPLCSSQIKLRATCPGGDCRLLDLSTSLVSPCPGSSVDTERVCDV